MWAAEEAITTTTGTITATWMTVTAAAPHLPTMTRITANMRMEARNSLSAPFGKEIYES